MLYQRITRLVNVPRIRPVFIPILGGGTTYTQADAPGKL
jgi:hypothetical protein